MVLLYLLSGTSAGVVVDKEISMIGISGGIIITLGIVILDINTLEKISDYVKVAEMCANMTSDKIDAWAKEQRKRNGENE